MGGVDVEWKEMAKNGGLMLICSSFGLVRHKICFPTLTGHSCCGKVNRRQQRELRPKVVHRGLRGHQGRPACGRCKPWASCGHFEPLPGDFRDRAISLRCSAISTFNGLRSFHSPAKIS